MAAAANSASLVPSPTLQSDTERLFTSVDGRTDIVTVSVTDHGLTWTQLASSVRISHFIKRRLILASHVSGTTITIHYVGVVRSGKRIDLRKKTVTFCGEGEACGCVDAALRDVISKHESHRPKRLLVLVNPISGTKSGPKVFSKLVLPYMGLCGVQLDHVVTKNEHHTAELLQNYDLSTIDGILSVGGDGSACQITMTLVRRATSEAGEDIDNPDACIHTPTIPIGALPTGSGCVLSHALNCSLDPETCVISVILGKTAKVDMMTLRNDGKYISTTCVMTGMGMNAAMFNAFETLRFMRKTRYWLVIPICLAVWRKYDVEIEYLPAADTKAQTPDQQSTKTDQHFPTDPNGDQLDIATDQQLDETTNKLLGKTTEQTDQTTKDGTTDGPLPGWKTFRGRVANVGLMPAGVKDYYHWLDDTGYQTFDLTSGKACLAISKYSGVVPMLRTLRLLKTHGRAAAPESEVEHIDVLEAKIKLLPPSSSNRSSHLCLNDGDVITMPNSAAYESKVYKEVLSVYVFDAELINEEL